VLAQPIASYLFSYVKREESGFAVGNFAFHYARRMLWLYVAGMPGWKIAKIEYRG
jgi:hypothetical protein